MREKTISQPDPQRKLPLIDLLELFAPTRLLTLAVTPLPRNEHALLWRADAIHRARNLAQMTTSLADVADHPSRRWLPPEVTTQARRLSRAYDELGVDDHAQAQAQVPCAALLTEIVTRLADIFGRSRQVSIVVSAEPVLLEPDVRRALLLMGSEMVINALKYGYPANPTKRGGTISVSLVARSGEVELIVEDDGVGLAETYSAGQGGGLLEQLRIVLDARVTRTGGASGHGFRVSTCVPIDVPQSESA